MTVVRCPDSFLKLGLKLTVLSVYLSNIDFNKWMVLNCVINVKRIICQRTMTQMEGHWLLQAVAAYFSEKSGN